MRARGRHVANPRSSVGAALAVVAALVLGVAVGTGAGVAGAAPAPPITDYASYPAALPEGCPDGTGAVAGARYDNGRGDEVNDLRTLSLRPGDTLRVSWDAFADGCVDPSGEPLIAVSLHAYDSSAPTFDPTVDQQLIDGWVACGAGLEPCPRSADGRYELSLAVPGPAASPRCNTQLEFVIGLPLAVVGPSGSYYNALLRGDDRPSMGIGATNFAIPDCVPGTSGTTVPPPPPPPPPPTTPPPSVSPTSAVAPTTAAPPATVLAAQVTSAPTSAPASAPVAVAGAQVSRLPETGSPTANLTLAGSALLLVGAALVLGSRRRAGERWG
jgi:LPXTG-motif cell wall-anchored protein